MSVWHMQWGHRLREGGMVVLGLVLAAVPLALWVAWSRAVFYAVLAAAVIAALMLVALAWLGRSAEAERPADAREPEHLNDEFIAELHRLTPLTYHHRRLGDPRLQRKFAKLRALLRRSAD